MATPEPSKLSPAEIYHAAAKSFLLHLTKISASKKEQKSHDADAKELENLNTSLTQLV